MPHCVRLGLTGGIGSGKSTVARLLAERGAAVVDADAIARQVTAVGGSAIPAIMEAFGPAFISPAGALDRDQMRSLVYTDPAAKQKLEAIIHPLVKLATENQASLLVSMGHPCIVFDIPLLVESRVWRRRLDEVMVVDCTPELQITRVMARNQLIRADVEKILTAQASREDRLRAADTVIFNCNLSLIELADEVRQISHRFGLSSG